MHKDFYASGFLFHPPTQKILLHQKKQDNGTLTEWLLFGDEGRKEETPIAAFIRVVKEHLRISLKEEKVLPVYMYFQEDLKKFHHIIYAEIEEMKEFSSKKSNFGWFTFKQAYKLQLSKQTKHNITVSQRVVDLAVRKINGTQPPEHT